MTDEEAEKLRAKWQDIISRGEEWYQKLQKELEMKYPRGSFVAIDVLSGQCMVGKSRSEASQQARETFPPDALYYVRGIVDACPDIQFAGHPFFEEFRHAREA